MPDPTIAELLKQAARPLLSFEFFPPKDDAGLATLRQAAERLLTAHPDFVTVTYGAGGSARARTLEVCDLLRHMGFGTVMPHLTCVASSRSELTEVADELHRRGYRNIMALRGDPPKGETAFRVAKNGLAHASDLVALLKARHPDICCGVAGYPEKHPEASSLETDIQHLKIKLAAGADFVTTQLFFENRFYTDFVRRCRAAGITQPILPGIMPALSHRQIQRFMAVCGATFPPPLAAQLAAAADDAAAAQIGMTWAQRQIEALLRDGVPGIHLYVLNRAHAAPLIASLRR
ncbi:MAG: methylenetetrahydrofolate reductase [NAD(P)H] [Verrucomicrobia bacterium]|nr:methylenetetrahydrofolate reductase [NAD(P)H] [Verrucomicrobiota bacterium]